MELKELNRLLSIGMAVAKEAGRKVLDNQNHYRRVNLDLDRDVKVKADFSVEALIMERLSKKSIHPILSEESGLHGDQKKSNYRWIVDPLDGSLNFSRGIPLCCISIALWDKMTPLLGIIYDFNRNELFKGIVGNGAWLNDIPIQVSRTFEKSKAILCTGFPVSTDFSDRSLMKFVGNIKEFKKVRLLGSAALSLAYVSCGRVDFYMENDIKIWDIAAGCALVRAAEGSVIINDIGKDNTLNVRASNRLLENIG